MSDSAAVVGDTVDAKVLLSVLAQVKGGDFTARMPLEWTGVAGKVADGLNDVIIANEALGTELARVSQVVGKQGKLSQRVVLGGTQAWSGSIESVNSLIDDLVRPTIEMQRVIGAVADGDLSKKISADVKGEMLELKNTINAMVDQLNGFISEVTRVAREVGTEGKLGQAAAVTIEVGGVWKDLTDNVNLMAGNLTGQVRNIAEVTTAVANGDLSKKISIDVKGEFLELKNTVNAMVDQLNAFAGEVTRVAREVGVEGRLGGQAQSKEVAGVWKDLTDNVNQLAANLTNQVRAISDVATAVTEGDLTRQVRVEASGEVAVLKDKLNEMIRNLRETTRENIEQDWLKTNRERFTRMLQGERDLAAVSSMILSELAPLVSAQHGVFYAMTSPTDGAEPVLQFQAGYGYEERKHLSTSFRVGEGLVGQCAKEKKRILLTEVPGDYVRVNSGLGESPPLNIIVLPVLFEGSVRAVVELASFSAFSVTHQAFLDQLPESIGLVLNTIAANTLTENLLEQSQSLAEELRSQQEELRESNADLERQARMLAEQNIEAEQRNQEIEQSKQLVEEKAGQLAVSSKYKSEFIANMSHELRTPLNSLLILAQQLEDNPDHNMTDTQVEYATVIHASGNELLTLLNGILDLAKVESGTVTADMADVSVRELRGGLLREFEQVAQGRGLGYAIDLAPDCPMTIVSDSQRLRQILKNLLANAFKFTDHGNVHVQIGAADSGWSRDTESLVNASAVMAVSVSDTGIGITREQQQRIFEAFAEGDGTTARVYGGTGLGLSISRELVGLLGGEITVSSSPGQGSTFTVYLPLDRVDPADDGASDVPALRAVPDQEVAASEVTVEAAPIEATAPRDRPRPNGLEVSAISGTKILLVDDDFRNIFALSALLERGHADVVVAESGAEAIAILEQNAGIDIVLMDIMMPVMDGYQTMRAIRRVDEFKNLAIIAVTGKVVPGERQRCIDAGADDYVPKPVDTAELLAALRAVVARALGGPGMTSVVPAKREATDAVAAIPKVPVPILLVDDNPTKRLALKSVLEPLGYAIVEADSGVAALRCVIAHDFAVILLDVCMPTMDGFETAALIRQRLQSETTPIIFITAFGSDDIDRTDHYAEGAVDFIFAPVPPEELRAKVSAFANIFIRAEQLAARALEVQRSADQLRQLTEAAPIGIFQTDPHNRYVYTNPRWSEITGISAEQAAGSVWGSLTVPKTRTGRLVALADTDVDRSDLTLRVEIEIPGSPPRIVVATSRVISDGAGGVSGRVGTLADVTAEVAAEAALSDARDKANEASRLKSDFLANMSHEIRTPMNGVIGMTDLLLETDLDARQRDYAQTVRNSGEALLTVINDILDFSRVEAGKLDIEDIEFNAANIVDDVVDLLAGAAQAKDLELVVAVDYSVPPVIRGDPGRVRQVLTNLLGNAIKFTQTGEIVVRISAVEINGTDPFIRFEISDTGDGIAADKLDSVFQPFVQADTSTSRRYGGTGLGLAISSQLVALMGGDCGVTSRVGTGSEFWFTIPGHSDLRRAAPGPSSRDADLAGVTALIVDDNAAERDVLCEYLTGWGMTVTTADSGEAALKAMRTAATRAEPFAVALLDRSMPGMDGLELANAIVMEPALTARLVLISSLGQEENLGSAADCGIFASVSKPLRREDLRVCLRMALGLQPADVAGDGVEAKEASDAEPAAGRLLLAEDNLINQKVAVAMLSAAGYRVDTVINGLAAVEAAAARHYDAVLMDCQMPELNGYEATAAIRANEGSTAHVPILAMTAGARREDRDRCLAAGMDGYLAKPVSKDALLALVARFVRRDEITVDPAVMDELRVLGEAADTDVLAELVDQFVHDTEPRLVQLREALEVGDAPTAGRIAHSIKGSGGQLGGRRLASSCGRLERKATAGRLIDAHTDLQHVELDYRELRHALTQQVFAQDRRRLRANP